MVTKVQSGGNQRRFIYTAEDQRVLTQDLILGTDTWRLRDLGGKPLTEYATRQGTLHWERDWIYRGGALLASESWSVGIRHYHLDHLGTPRLITNRCGGPASEHHYYPFGEEAVPCDQAEPLKFTGHERDFLGTIDGTTYDLDYMLARHYSMHLARFTRPDPVLGSVSSPQTWNRYSYAWNSPLNFIDPLGLSPKTPVEPEHRTARGRRHPPFLGFEWEDYLELYLLTFYDQITVTGELIPEGSTIDIGMPTDLSVRFPRMRGLRRSFEFMRDVQQAAQDQIAERLSDPACAWALATVPPAALKDFGLAALVTPEPTTSVGGVIAGATGVMTLGPVNTMALRHTVEAARSPDATLSDRISVGLGVATYFTIPVPVPGISTAVTSAGAAMTCIRPF